MSFMEEGISFGGVSEFAGAGGIAEQDSAGPVLVYVGVLPAGKPRYVVGVVVDRPLSGYYTPESARLLFEEIAGQVGDTR
jgi:cell division protein FtsI/penicillin-binding protein 2